MVVAEVVLVLLAQEQVQQVMVVHLTQVELEAQEQQVVSQDLQ